MSDEAQFFLMQLTLLGTVLILHTYLGLHIIRRTLIFSDLVLDQLAALGALVGIAGGIEYGAASSYFVSLLFVLVGAALLAVLIPRRNTVPREAVIGVLYALALVGSLLLGDKLPGGGADVDKTLSGVMLWVSWPLILATITIYLLLLIFHYLYRARFLALVEDQKVADSAKNATRFGNRWWDFLFFTTQGIITVLIVPIAGVLLAYAFLMIPAAIALLFTRRWGLGLLIGWLAGFLSCSGGLAASYFWDLPYSPTLILCMGAVFLLAIIWRMTFPEAEINRLKKG